MYLQDIYTISLSRKHTKLTLDDIGSLISISYDHSSVLHGIGIVKDLITVDKKIAYVVSKIAGDIYVSIKKNGRSNR